MAALTAEMERLSAEAARAHEVYTIARAAGSDSAEDLMVQMIQAQDAAREAQRALTTAQRGRAGMARFSDAHLQRQLFAQRDFPGVPEQYLQQAQDIINEEMSRAARRTSGRSHAVGGDSFMEVDRAVELATRHLLEGGAEPGMVNRYADILRGQLRGPIGRGAPPPRTAVSQSDLDAALRRVREEMDRAAREAALPDLPSPVGRDTAASPMARRRVEAARERAAQMPQIAPEILDGGESALRGEMDQMVQRSRAAQGLDQPTTPPGQRWEEVNREYTLGRYLRDRVGADAPGGGGAQQGLARAQAVRGLMSGNPGAFIEQEALAHITPVASGFARGVYARGAEGLAAGTGSLAQRLERAVGADPARFGRFADGIRDAATRGPAEVAAYHYQQSMRDAEYQQMLEENDFLWNDEDGTDPEIYDILSEGLTEDSL